YQARGEAPARCRPAGNGCGPAARSFLVRIGPVAGARCLLPDPSRRRAQGRPSDHAMIRITDRISIEERELEERFVRASGPGGQNVNKLSSAVQLRFDVRRSPSLAADVRMRLERLAGRRLT